MNFTKHTGVVLTTVLILVFIALCLAGPLLTILALNTLFSLTIGYTFSNWLAMFWLQLLMLARFNSK